MAAASVAASRRIKRGANAVQRLCGLCFAMFIFFQTPLITIPVATEGQYRDVPLSPAEITAIGILEAREDFLMVTQLALAPGSWWKALARQGFACINPKRKQFCDPAKLLDGQALLDACDLRPLVGPFRKAAGAATLLLTLSSSCLVACAVAMTVVPDLLVVVAALAAFAWGALQCGCWPLPTTLFLSLLGLLAVFGREREPRRGAGKAKGSRQAEGVVQAGAGAQAGKPGSGQSKKRR
ncbi:hypothetical protein HYH03_004093 [Edaphochlamys debaryana]|uniref:Uncharacterized protein n=1 Tax=Edaphochlamys debaryana TaxID=47281 RepID=A0A835Y838_9CHLO|nr:hypothetical protein HYH03_004093 [Edaphochlamys debaryana]|eukprot:KAG2497823.1 hypothetical protein HYH03_004093 [Edaphochlamys debaryana]